MLITQLFGEFLLFQIKNFKQEFKFRNPNCRFLKGVLNLRLKRRLSIPKHDPRFLGNVFWMNPVWQSTFLQRCLFFNALKVLTNDSGTETEGMLWFAKSEWSGGRKVLLCVGLYEIAIVVMATSRALAGWGKAFGNGYARSQVLSGGYDAHGATQSGIGWEMRHRGKGLENLPKKLILKIQKFFQF